MSLKSVVRESLRGSALYRPVRDTYLRLFNPAALERDRALKRFYEPFVGPGDLVFDVGANEGDHTVAFLALGARVVAVEPNPEALALLRKAACRKLIVEPVAVGDREGIAKLRLAQSHKHGSLSPEWQIVTAQLYRRAWNGTMPVPVVTLDSLIRKHGMPALLKIDTEGFELPVLSTLRQMPRVVSFEFFTARMDTLRAILDLPCFVLARYNCVHGEDEALALPEWVDKDGLLRHIEGLGVAYGDVLAR